METMLETIYLAGDFNARTAELKDFSVFTENDFPNGDEYLLEYYSLPRTLKCENLTKYMAVLHFLKSTSNDVTDVYFN
jgi:hypothetical protein